MLLRTATHSEGKGGGNKYMVELERMETKIPGLVSYKSFPQKTTDFSSHTL